MTYDCYVDSDGCLTFDEFGDVSTVAGEKNVKQQIRLAVTRTVGVINVTPTDAQSLRELRQSVRRGLESAPYVDRVVSVSINAPTDERIVIDVRTQSEQITMEY